jgi:hypothetical protein
VDNIFPKKVACPDEVVEYITHQKPLSQEPLLTECNTTTSSPVDNTQETVKQTSYKSIRWPQGMKQSTNWWG